MTKLFVCLDFLLDCVTLVLLLPAIVYTFFFVYNNNSYQVLTISLAVIQVWFLGILSRDSFMALKAVYKQRYTDLKSLFENKEETND